MGRSKAQDALADTIQECFPQSYVSQENYIGDLIEEFGYSKQEIRRELGHDPHKMFVDIVLRDSEYTIAFEYHGEQHYSLVGNMTKTNADLLLNQQLDQEKSWILARIGVPLVAVPYDMYIDKSVLYAEIEKAIEEVAEYSREYSPCVECQRLFPSTQMSYGVCKACAKRLEEEAEEAARAQEEAEYEYDDYYADGLDYDMEDPAGDSSMPPWGSDEYKQIQKQKAKEARKAAREAYKATPEYQKRQEEKKAREKAYRKEMNRKRREENRKKRAEERQRKRDLRG